MKQLESFHDFIAFLLIFSTVINFNGTQGQYNHNNCVAFIMHNKIKRFMVFKAEIVWTQYRKSIKP